MILSYNTMVFCII